ncbi:hypothetical protein [Spirosoma foliorum]|uniref:hypothetical protein n=1 Tax=Spirosoma foliorum TaxID=2710596 RepID=UPI001C7134FC|nr:hypothetical protein [Spirosoma foliorum]
MLPLSERVKTIFDALDTSAHKFAKDHDFSRTSLFNILSGRNQPIFGLIERMCAAEPRISAEYLLRGEGEPLRDKRQSVDLTTVEQLREFKNEMIQALDKRIQELGG